MNPIHLFKQWLALLLTILTFAVTYLPGCSFASYPSNHQIEPSQEVHNLEGTLEIRAVVYLKEKESIQYLLKQKDGSLYYLHFSDELPHGFKTGAQIQIRHASKISTPSHHQELLTTAKDLILIKDVDPKAIPSAFGPQKTIVFLINFQDQPLNRPWTLDQVRTVIFNRLSDMYYESSYQQTTVIGNVIGWYTVPLNSNMDCNTMANAIPGLAASAAARAGIDLSPYRRRVYLFPNNPTCGWAGLGTIAGSQYSNAWINGYNDLSLIGHEMGHNLGLYHSHALHCPGSSNQGNCTVDEYGDLADIMGIEGTGHFNAFQKERLGWLNYQSSPPIRSVTSSSTYFIDPYESTNLNNKALKVLKRTLADGSSDYYYLEFRHGLGFDSDLGNCTNCDFTKGVLIHQANSADPNSSNLLDMSPTDNNFRRVSLLPGRSFSDPNAAHGGVTFRVNSVSNLGASVNITFGRSNPSQQYSYNVVLGYPFSEVIINGHIHCPNSNGNTCLITNQSVGTNITITGNNNHLCTLAVQANGNLLVAGRSNYCYANIQAASAQPGSISLPSQF